MAKRGPPPKPTALKKLEGNPGKRRLPEEPTIEEAPEDCPPPKHLSATAQEEWRRLYPVLQSCGLLTLADLSAFAIYCSLWGRWREAEDALAKQAKLLKTPNGSLQPNPWITISRQSAELLKGYMAEFGMVPASRARMGGAEPPRSGDAAKPPLAGGKFAHLIGAEDKPN